MPDSTTRSVSTISGLNPWPLSCSRLLSMRLLAPLVLFSICANAAGCQTSTYVACLSRLSCKHIRRCCTTLVGMRSANGKRHNSVPMLRATGAMESVAETKAFAPSAVWCSPAELLLSMTTPSATPSDGAVAKATAALRYVTATHVTGTQKCTDGKPWGATEEFARKAGSRACGPARWPAAPG